LEDVQRDPKGQKMILDTIQKQIDGYQAVIDKLKEYQSEITKVGQEASKKKDFTAED